MSDKVIEFPGQDGIRVTQAPRCRAIEPEAVANGLQKNLAQLDMLVVIGVTHDGVLYAASTHPDTADTVLLLERMKRKLMMPFGDDELAE